MSEGAVTFYVTDGAEFVPRLFAELGVEITSVNLSRPSLDDVFMSFTGSTIRTPRSHRPGPQPGDDAGDDGGTAMSTAVVRVRVPERSYRSELRAIKIVWSRE